MTRTHSEVLHAATIVPPGRALDLGIMTKRDADYFSQKYSLTRTHSEVLHAATIVPPGRALDLG
ncbi:hypothetical protein CKQ90_35830, partial [Klebsiella pneumoniae]